jgi:hypothetical protein
VGFGGRPPAKGGSAAWQLGVAGIAHNMASLLPHPPTSCLVSDPPHQMRATIKSVFPDRDAFTLLRPMLLEDDLARLDTFGFRCAARRTAPANMHCARRAECYCRPARESP